MSSAMDKSNRKFSVFGSLANWLPSRSDLTLGTNWAKPAAVLGADSGMPVVSSRLIKQSDLYCTNWGFLWADLGSPTAPRLHGSIQRARIERLSYARRSLGAGEETQPRPPVVEADREGPSAAADVVAKTCHKLL